MKIFRRLKLSRLSSSKAINTISIVISIVSILIATYSNNLSSSANEIALQANRNSENANIIANESKNISKAGLDFQKDVRSEQICDEAFTRLYDNESNSEVMFKLKRNELIKDNNKILKVVDIFEGAGNSFCQGNTYHWHLNTTLKNSLNYICNNEEVFQNYGGQKNGLAILCYEFYPQSLFSETLNWQNLNTCVFRDSVVFPISH